MRKSQVEALFDLLWNTSPIGYALISKNQMWLRTNPSLSRIVEYSEPELQELTWMDITHPKDLKADLQMANEVAEGKRPNYPMEKRYISKFGETVRVRIMVRPFYNKDKEFQFYLVEIIPKDKEHYQPPDTIEEPPKETVWQKYAKYFLALLTALGIIAGAAIQHVFL